MIDRIDLSGPIARATIAARRPESTDPYMIPLARLASAVRHYLETLDAFRDWSATREDLDEAERDLRYAVYGPPLDVAPLMPRTGGIRAAIARAWRRLVHGWEP